MPRRKLEERNDVQVIFRTSADVKARIDAEADALGVTTADWLRTVVMEKLDGRADNELHDIIKDVVLEMKKEKII